MISCPICKEPAGPPVETLCECGKCSHVFQYPGDVAVHYDAAYVSKYDRYPTSEMSLLRIGFLKAFVRGGRLLDVGYGKGDFVRAATAAGFDAYGSDIHGVDFGIREVALANDCSSWNVVTFYDSLEHFPDFDLLRRLFQRARHVLVSVPLRPSTFPARRQWHHFKPGEHLHYFSESSLRELIPKPLLAVSNVEDVIRRNAAPGPQNILTAIFGSGARNEPTRS